MLTKEQALDILDQLEFFQGQRAGRELWSQKNRQLQNIDIACFVKHITDLREYITNGGDWISVDERLPEKDGRYLVYGVIGGQPLVCGMYYNKYNGFDGEITHWMPLPEPPQMKGGAE